MAGTASPAADDGSSDLTIASISVATQRLPSSPNACRTVVSGGQKCPASGMSSKPTTLTSRGTSKPASRNACMSPSAIWSLDEKTALNPRFPRPARTSDLPAWYPDSAVQSP